jgi:hypothetical protein
MKDTPLGLEDLTGDDFIQHLVGVCVEFFRASSPIWG